MGTKRISRIAITVLAVAAATAAPAAGMPADPLGTPGSAGEPAPPPSSIAASAADDYTVLRARAAGVATDLRGEHARVSGLPGATDVRGEFAKPELRGEPVAVNVAPADGTEPADGPIAWPFIIAGLAALIGVAAVVLMTPPRRRTRVVH